MFSEQKSFSSQKENTLGNIKFEAVQESLSKTDHKREQYKKFTDEDRFEIGKYAVIHGSSSTVKRLKNWHPHLKENTVRNFHDKYRENVNSKTGNFLSTKKISALKRGRPLMLGHLDEK